MLSQRETDEPYFRDVSDHEIEQLFGGFGIASQAVRAARIKRVTVRAIGRRLEYVRDRALLEELLNSSEFPVSEIESLHSRIGLGQFLQMCLVEESAEQVVFVAHTKSAEAFGRELQQALAAHNVSKGWTLKSMSLDATHDMLSVRLRGRFTIRRIWGGLVRDKSNRVVIVWTPD